jgi:hypothetical protein
MLTLTAAETVLLLIGAVSATFGIRGFGRLEDGNRIDWNTIIALLLASTCIALSWVLIIRHCSWEHYLNWYHHRHVLPARVSRTREEMERIMLDAAERGEANGF